MFFIFTGIGAPFPYAAFAEISIVHPSSPVGLAKTIKSLKPAPSANEAFALRLYFSDDFAFYLMTSAATLQQLICY